jgi:hypothetical protein
MKPAVFLKRGCPFSMKVRLFLLEAGLLDRVDVRAFDNGSDEESRVAGELAPHFEKVTYPSARLADGSYKNGSVFAGQYGIDAAALPTLQDYSTGVCANLIALFKENMSLKAKAG